MRSEASDLCPGLAAPLGGKEMAQLQAYTSGGTTGSCPVWAAGGDPSGRGAVGRGVREGGSTKTLRLCRQQHGALESAGPPPPV